MNEILEIEQSLSEWKANLLVADDDYDYLTSECIKSEIFGLEFALAILKRPSNTQMHMDTKPTCIKKQWHEFYIANKYNYCPECGVRL